MPTRTINKSLFWLGLAGVLPLAADVQSANWQSSIWREPQFCSQLADMLGSGNAATPHTWQAAEVPRYLLEQKRAGPQQAGETFKFSVETS